MFHRDVVPVGKAGYTLARPKRDRVALAPIKISWTGPQDVEHALTVWCHYLTDREGDDHCPVVYGLTGTEAAIADFLLMHGNYIRQSGRDDEDLRIYHELIDDIDDNLRRLFGYDPRTETHASVRLELEK